MLPLDNNLFVLLHSLAGRSGLLDWLFVFLASWLPWLFVVAAVIVIVRSRPWRRGLWLTLGIGLTLILSRGIIASLLHELVARSRPFAALSFEPLISVSPEGSFPSGHAAAFFAIAFVLLYANRKRGWWFVGLAALMSTARVIAGVHYPSDVVAGALVALASAFAVHILIKRYAPEEMKPLPPEPASTEAPAETPAGGAEPPAVDALTKI